uniref:Trans-enoyl reductase pgmF n=1 Tax=Aspergillus terreus TaxID=33178 RepID=PGMF_ASPTE|nr:RecName: Full=Trans-enoyl reductase pgmF; AltName: Full=Pigmented naphthoquinones biosynthesis cluster protein F [Aspergillus terreus]ARB51367.1 putative quinone reductase [Aspergillus terreus]
MASTVPSTMKAWQFSSASPTIEANLKLNNNAPLPDGANNLGPDQVLVKVIAAGLNPVDFKFAEIPWLGRLIVGSPSTPGMDFAGRVVATGPNTKSVAVEDLKPGQLVFGRLDSPSKFGTLAEYTIAPRKGCVAIPPGARVIETACVASVGLTAYQSIVYRLKDHTGKRIFLNGGSGGCGTFGIQIAKQMGCHVTTSCSTPNVDLCRSLGADTVIDYKKTDVIAELKKMQPFDLVVDNVGVPTDLYWAAPSFTNPGAPYVQVGALAVTPGFILGNFFKARWPGWLGGGKRPWEFMHIESNVQDYEQLGRWMQEGKLRAVVDEVFGMQDDGPVKAYQKLRTGRAKGKIIVKIDETWED